MNLGWVRLQKKILICLEHSLVFGLALGSMIVLSSATLGFADEGGDAGADSGGDAAPVAQTRHLGKNKRRGTREKETEGTEAPNRFEADSTIKSHYQLNGQSLEVDPD